MSRSHWIELTLAFLIVPALSCLAMRTADAEQSGRAGVKASLDVSIMPKQLPRDRAAPVFLQVGGGVHSTDGSLPPYLGNIEIAFASRGGLSTVGLPRCPRPALRASDTRHALRACGSALVGHGELSARMELPGQSPTHVLARILAFNGRTRSGQAAVWVLVSPRRPALPASFVLPFYLRRPSSGPYGFVLRAPVSKTLGRWWRLRSFQITLGRRYRVAGHARSYISATCPLPPRFHHLVLPLARATYRFAPGPTIVTQVARSCRVRAAR